MKSAAIVKCRVRLQRVKSSIERLENCTNFKEFSDAWTDFLLAHNSIYSILEHGAKNSPQSRQWYGGKKRLGREDHLLRYLHQARNADEHGIEPVAQHVDGSLAIGVGGESVHIESMTFNALGQPQIKLRHVDGKLPTVKVTQPHPKLIAVLDDRFGETWFHPPTEHLGAQIEDASPLGIAKLTLNYCTTLVDEAERLA